MPAATEVGLAGWVGVEGASSMSRREEVAVGVPGLGRTGRVLEGSGYGYGYEMRGICKRCQHQMGALLAGRFNAVTGGQMCEK